MNMGFRILFLYLVFLAPSLSVHGALAQEGRDQGGIDAKVKQFLERHRGKWTDWNVPEIDGKLLFSLIIKNNYQRALEIGTSTGHSALWMAWALSKTHGNLITIEIHEGRHRTAQQNFQKSGLSPYIDARLGDAHDLVKELKGPFDFIFLDADKDWYTRYFKELAPKLEKGGCFAAHNVLWRRDRGIRDFLEYVGKLPNFRTFINRESPAGVSISYKRAEN
jgi:predicted O-methyltransferase YrrM